MPEKEKSIVQLKREMVELEKQIMSVPMAVRKQYNNHHDVEAQGLMFCGQEFLDQTNTKDNVPMNPEDIGL